MQQQHPDRPSLRMGDEHGAVQRKHNFAVHMHRAPVRSFLFYYKVYTKSSIVDVLPKKEK